MTNSEQQLVIGLIEDALDKLAMEDCAGAEVLMNRALYWLQGMEGDTDFDDPQLELEF